MAAPLGNKNAGKSKPWTDAIRRAIARRDAETGIDGAFLNTLADQLLADCLNSDGKEARTELTNRLDGKHVQPTELSGDLSITKRAQDLTDDELATIAIAPDSSE